MSGLLPLALEVMDKEPSTLAMWGLAVSGGAVGYVAARWRRWTAWVTVGIVGLAAFVLLSELRDPDIGPAILRETNGRYPWHGVGSLALAIGMTLAGTRRSVRGAA